MRISRRNVLKAASALAAPLFVPASALGKDGQTAPSNRITIGMIGVGSHGQDRNLSGGFLNWKDARVLAVCDVDDTRAAQAKAKAEKRYDGQGVDSCRDFRQVLERKDIDAVMVSTPDHWHVPISVMAMRAGKDVICEKPLTLTISEGKLLVETARRYGRITQTSSENRSSQVYHRICELVRNGRIGRLRKIEVGLPTGWSVQPASKQVQPPPPTLDWDLWLGPAPAAPYSPARCHWNFRWIMDYSGGMLTDWGAHLIDIAQWGHDSERSGPVEVEGRGEWPQDSLYDTATKWDLNYAYADGVKLRVFSDVPSIRFEGTDGWVRSMGWLGKVEASSDRILESTIGSTETRLFTCPDGEHRNFLDCVKSRTPCYAPFEVGHRTITIAHLGNIAMKTGRKLRWDPAHERFPDDDQANRMLSRPMRAPWSL